MSTEDTVVTPELEQEEETPLQSPVKDLIKTNNGPDDLQIEEWKQQFQEVFVMAFSEKEVYIYRPLCRAEFTNLQVAQQTAEALDQFEYEEAICRTCVLWSSGNGFSGTQSKGGTASTLAETIMANSNFWSPQQAALYTVQL